MMKIRPPHPPSAPPLLEWLGGRFEAGDELKKTRINTHVSLMGRLEWHHTSF